MALAFFSTAPNTSADYRKYIYDTPVKDDRDGDAILLDFTLANTDSSFKRLSRGNYIKFTTNTYPIWYTGYITNEPEYVYLGEKAGVPHWGYRYEASSDEIILSQNALGIIPPFLNMTQGEIIKALAAMIAPGLFDVSNVQDGLTLARYVVDPTKKFSDVVKEFSTAAVYRFYGQDHKLYFVPKTSITQGLTVDGHSLRFTPSDLTVKASTNVPIINDAVVMGGVEPQRFTTEYFVGTGFDGAFKLSSSVFGVESVIMLDDDFSGTSFDSSRWTVYDQPTNYMLLTNGFLNVIGGTGTGAYNVHLDSANLIQLSGSMRIAHGEFDFVPQTTDNLTCGVIGGLWTQAPNSSFTGCVYGLRVSKASGVVKLNPIVGGVVDTTQSLTVDTNGTAGNPPAWSSSTSYNVGAAVYYGGAYYVCIAATSPGIVPTNPAYWALAQAKRYVIRTLVSSQTIYTSGMSYNYIASDGTIKNYGGGQKVSVQTYHTYITEIDPNTGLITSGFPIVWTNTLVPTTNQTFANYIIVASNDLHVTVTGLTISTPMQATLGLQTFGQTGNGGFLNKLVGPNEIDATDGLAPYATISQSGGQNTKSNVLGTPQYHFGDPTLQFFKDSSNLTATTPQKGDIIRLEYRSAGVAVGRSRDNGSVNTEAMNWGDAGIRSVVRNGDITPVPQTSDDCEAAAAAIIGQNAYTHYEGTYRVPAQNVTAEPVAGAILPFTNLTSDFPVSSFNEQISEVKTNFQGLNGSTEIFIHEITFGLKNDSIRLLSTLSKFALQSDVFTTIDSTEIPKYIPVSGVSLGAYAPDVTNPRMDLTNGGTYGAWQASHDYSGVGHITILDSNGNLQHLSTVGISGSTVPTWANLQNNIVPIGSIVGCVFVTVASGVLTLESPVDVTAMLNVGTVLALSGFTTAIWLNGTSITVTSINGKTFTATTGHADVARASDSGIGTVTASGGLPLTTPDGTCTWTLLGHAYGVDATHFYFDVGSAPPTGGAYEVRYTDTGWGCDDGSNLAGRFTTQKFSLPRNKRNSVVFIKAQDVRNVLCSSETWVAYDGSNQYVNTPWQGFSGSGHYVTLVQALDPDGHLGFINKCVLPGSHGIGGYINTVTKTFTVSPDQKATFSVSVKGTAGQMLWVQLYDGVGGDPVVTQYFTFTGQWQRISVSYTFPHTASGSYQLFANMGNLGSGEVGGYTPPATLTFYGTRASVESNSAAETVYCKTQDSGLSNVAVLSAYGATSRFAASVACSFPFVPQPPTGFMDTTDIANPIVNVLLPSVADDVWGVEIRASDNATVLYQSNLTDSGYAPQYTVANNTSRSLNFYLYTYNLLGEYSASYNLIQTIPTPSASSLSVDEVTKTLKWTGSSATGYTVEIDATDNTFTHDVLNKTTPNQYFTLGDPDFFKQRYFRVTPYDAIGNGSSITASHVYTPDAVAEFNGNEVYAIPAPSNPTTNPTVPTGIQGKYDTEFIEQIWKEFHINLGGF
jgi:hypothetical protein